MELDDRLKAKVRAYQVSAAALDPIRQAPLLFTVGITGAGKNALLDYLLDKYPERYQFMVSHTTRAPRDYEQQDVHYHFTDFAEVDRMLDSNEFIEAQIIHFDNIYGTSINEIKRAEEAGKIAVTDLDIKGVDRYNTLGLNAKAVFLLPPTYDIWKQRLLARYDEAGEIDNKDLANRLKSALREIEHALKLEYYYIVINDDLAKTAELVNDIAMGEPVETHYHKAVVIAEEILHRIQAELAELEA